MQAGPAISRHQLGVRLRQLRKAQSLRLEDAAAKLGVVPSTLCRIEAGKAPTKDIYLCTLIDLYGVDDPPQREQLMEMAAEGRRKDWCDDYANFLPSGMGTYLGLEVTAEHVRGFSTHTVPALVQTPGYAEAFFKATRPELEATGIRGLVTLQLRRQRPTEREGRPLDLILDESVLLRSIGSPQVMAEQLAHIVTFARKPSVTVRVIRLATAQPLLSPSFTLLDLRGSRDSVVAFMEGIGAQVDIGRRAADVDATQCTFAALAASALPPTESAKLIGRYASNCR